MLSLVTGNPGAGKTLYTVAELIRPLIGATIESNGVAVPRVVHTNIKGLLLDHVTIGAAELDTWHKWAKPGDVIVFDEVQELWRPRAASVKVPDCIQALETHRHMGVDIILITQHPMLVDQNVRRLVNRHLEVRRVAGMGLTVVYEWDACANDPKKQRGSCVDKRPWAYKKDVYKLYKSAQLHTKPPTRIPSIAFLGIAALAAALYLVPNAYSRITQSFAGGHQKATQYATLDVPALGASSPRKAASSAAAPLIVQSPQSLPLQPGADVAAPVLAGCIVVKTDCLCMSITGAKLPPDLATCSALANGKPPMRFPEVAPAVVASPEQIQRDTEVMAAMRSPRY